MLGAGPGRRWPGGLTSTLLRCGSGLIGPGVPALGAAGAVAPGESAPPPPPRPAVAPAPPLELLPPPPTWAEATLVDIMRE
jgi:hypothetical protein